MTAFHRRGADAEHGDGRDAATRGSILSQRFGADTSLPGRTIFFTTLVSIATFPVLYAAFHRRKL